MARLVALDDVHVGLGGVIRAGEEIPDTFLNIYGDPEPVDTRRLVELGVAGKPSDLPAGPTVPAAEGGYEQFTKGELEGLAAGRDIQVPAKATKQAIIALLVEQDAAGA